MPAERADNDTRRSASRQYQRIAQRPLVVNERSRLGDREGNLIVGPMSRSAVGTLVERKSRQLRLIHLPDGHGSTQLVAALTASLARTDAATRLTLTCTNARKTASRARRLRPGEHPPRESSRAPR